MNNPKTVGEVLCEISCDQSQRDHCKNRQKEWTPCDELTQALQTLSSLVGGAKPEHADIGGQNDEVSYQINNAYNNGLDAYETEIKSLLGLPMGEGKGESNAKLLQP